MSGCARRRLSNGPSDCVPAPGRAPAASKLQRVRPVLRAGIGEGGGLHRWRPARPRSRPARAAGWPAGPVTSAPSGASASLIALTIAAGGPIAPLSPMPFWPKVVQGLERLHVVEPHVGHLGRAGQQVVGEGRGQRLARVVVRHLLVERGADALRQAAQHLAVDDHRVHQLAAILDDQVVLEHDGAGLGVDPRPRRHGRHRSACRCRDRAGSPR